MRRRELVVALVAGVAAWPHVISSRTIYVSGDWLFARGVTVST